MGRIIFFMDEAEQHKLLKTFESTFTTIYNREYKECIQNDPPVYQNKNVWYTSSDDLDFTPTRGEHMCNDFYIVPTQFNNGELNGITYFAGGVWEEKYIIHGEFYILNDNIEMRKPFNELRKMIRAMSAKQIGGYFIGKETYKNKDKYERFITIGVKSPIEYDLTVD